MVFFSKGGNSLSLEHHTIDKADTDLHGRLVHKIVEQGNTIVLEKVTYKRARLLESLVDP